ncbi:transposase [Leptospira koniambonensis]|uniref:transposase n=1 Tax=Leptospira koniambonensis TaxID=2484950 RepID=UPI003EBEAF90
MCTRRKWSSLRSNVHNPSFFVSVKEDNSSPDPSASKIPIHKSLRLYRNAKDQNLGIDTDLFNSLTLDLLNRLYPKTCTTPSCNHRLLDKEISTRPDVIRCSKCYYQTSRLSYTPLHHFKLPLWMFGYLLHESLIQYPKVVTATELSKRLQIGYKAASLLKRRFQLFCSDQLPKYKDLVYDALEHQFKNFKLDPNENVSITKKMRNKPYICADTAVLYSASQRANGGRSRYRSNGATASIYMSSKLGGRQIGTLVQTIGIKNGPAFFTSVPNQKAETLGPILRDHIPFSAPLYTDEAYSWLFGIYQNHRSVNHSARSKDNRYRWARNRWCKKGVHNQVAEGNQRLLKSSFSAYGYIKPEYSQLYLNEFSFLKNAKVLGLEHLVENTSDTERVGSGSPRRPVRIRHKE